ncbi:MAG: fluoride efflux transporter CrcB [Bacteroidia bacterium]|nr:fluoride efflux transporter CrcB [Bacteroidia bacterium]
MGNLLAIFVGGGLGSLARYGLAVWLSKSSAGFPFGTLLANVLACLILGFMLAVVEKNLHFNEQVRNMVLYGFCGGFSTFSTFSNETLVLLQGEKPLVGVFYIALSVLLCVGAVFGGIWFGKTVLN